MPRATGKFLPCLRFGLNGPAVRARDLSRAKAKVRVRACFLSCARRSPSYIQLSFSYTCASVRLHMPVRQLFLFL